MIPEADLREADIVSPLVRGIKIPDQRWRFRGVTRKRGDMRQQNRDKAKLNLTEGLLRDKLAADFEMDADLSELLQWGQLDVRCPSLQCRFQNGESEIPRVSVLRHPPIKDPRIKIMHDARYALASLSGSEQWVVRCLILVAHNG